jgi:predicted ATPase/class 3 adenylate cyclase
MGDLPSGTLTLLFTDIEGSTRILQTLGEGYPAVLEQHRELLRATFTWYGGTEVGTQGDSFFVVFPRASEAVAAVIAAQRSLAEHPWPPDGIVRVRMGLHLGEPQLTAEGYAGIDVHRAARIAGAAHGGQVVLSEATAAAVRQLLPDDVTLHDLGEHRLKDLVHPEHLYQLDIAGLSSAFPTIRSLDTHPNNLSTPATPIIGRGQEIEHLVTLLRREEVRLVTLTGPGGTGKTRLALRVAAELLHDFRDGVFFVALAPLTDPALVVPAIAQTLEIRDDGRPAEAALTEHLREKQVLLVLDNVEQVIDAAPAVARTLGPCAGVRLLATSRAALRLAGERELAVPPLPLPDPALHEPADRLSVYAAVELFIERAAAVRADFQITNENAPAVAAICARLDGLPLAIELAAARIRVLQPQALLARLDSALGGLRLLTGGRRDLDARHQTLRAAIQWSWDLLSSAEQTLLRRLAVFVGGWTLEVAEAVCDDAGDLGVDVLDGLTSLVEKSLVRQEQQAPDTSERFSMMETIREFAAEQLGASGERDRIERRHADAYRGLAVAAQQALRAAGFVSGVPEVDLLVRELANVRAAVVWAVAHAEADVALQLAGSAGGVVVNTGASITEGRRWLEDALALPDASAGAARASALTTLSMVLWLLGDFAASAEAARSSSDLWRQTGDTHGLARALLRLGQALITIDIAEARRVIDEATDLFRALDDRSGIAMACNARGIAADHDHDWESARTAFDEVVARMRPVGRSAVFCAALANLGLMEARMGAYDDATSHLEEALAAFRQVGVAWGMARCLGGLAIVACLQEQPDPAALWLRELIDVARPIGGASDLARALECAAWVAALRCQWPSAAGIAGAAAETREQHHAFLPPTDPLKVAYDTVVDRIATALGASAFAAASDTGRALSLDQAIDEALAITGEPAVADEAPSAG